MVISSFLGVLLIAMPPAGVTAQGEVPSADIIIGTGYSSNLIVHNQGSYPFDGNLTIRAGGTVEIINSTAIFRSSYSGGTPVGSGVKALTVTVEDGGMLILDNSTLTMDVHSGNLIPALGVVVRHGGILESRTSNISFSGHLLVDDAKLTLIDSTISGVKSVFNSTYFPTKVFSSSPVLMFMSSDVTMISSRIINMYDNGTYNSVLLTPYSNNYQFAKDTSSRQFVDYFLERDVNAAFGASSVGLTGQTPLSMTMNDTKNVTVAPNAKLYTTGFDMAGLVFESTDVVSVTLHVDYLTDTTFSTGGLPNAFYYTPQYGTATVTPITITPTYSANDPSGTNANVTKSYTFPATMSAQSLGKMTVNFTNARNSNVYIDRIWLTIDMHLSTYRNLTLGGSTNFIAADSYIQLNNINENNGTNAKNGAYHKLVALDQSIANLYGLTVANSTGGFNGTNVFKTKSLAKVITANGTNDATGQNVNGLYAQGDGAFYDVGIGQTMNIVKYNTGELTGSIKSILVSFAYYTDAGYVTSNYIQYSINSSAPKNTNMQLTFHGGVVTTGPFDLYANGVTSISQLRALKLSFTNGGGAIVHFDRMYINIVTQPEVAVYRWMELNVTDNQFVPVNNAGVSASIIGSNVAAFYLTQTGVATAPPQAILDYLGKTGTNYNRTGVTGFVKIPLLTDVLNSSNVRNGKAFDYNLVFKYRNSDGLYVLDDSSGGISTNFTHFPDLVTNADVRNVMFPTLSTIYSDIVLSGTTVLPISGDSLYQVKGNIVVKDNAKLIISSGTLKLASTKANQFKITVSGSGAVLVSSGMITSDYPMQIFLTDNAVFSAANGSILPAYVKVNIDGNAKVLLAEDNFIAANFTAPSTSYGNLTATNVTFINGLDNFGGHATAVFTGVSLPSIALQDEAKAWNYRWLTVNVMDGTKLHGIANAYVEVDRSAGALYATAKTGASGAALFRLLSDNITLSGASHFDNYRINATYWFHGKSYNSTGEISGKYTLINPDVLVNGTQIVKNDIVTSVFIMGALPELDPPFWASNYSPARGGVVYLTTNVTNTGIVTAYNVLVRFKDVSTGALIADRTIASIAPGAYSNISVPWTATYPVGVHTLNVTIDPFGAIPQLSRANNWNQLDIKVNGVPDLSVTSDEIIVNPSTPVTNSTAVTIQAFITNSGDNMEHSVVISFYDVFNHNRTLIGNFTLAPILSGQTAIAYPTPAWQNMWPGIHNITVVIDEQNLSLEASKSNNQAGLNVQVLDYPNLWASYLQFKLSSTGVAVSQVNIGDQVTLSASVMNTGQSTASNFVVRFWLGSPSNGIKIGDVVVQSLVSGGTTDVQYDKWIASVDEGSGQNQSRLISVEVNPLTNNTPIRETNYDHNSVNNTLLVVDNRADLWYPTGVSVKTVGGVNSTSFAVQGQSIYINFTLANKGINEARGALLDIYVIDNDNLPHVPLYLMNATYTLAQNESKQVSFLWVVNFSPGNYTLVVEVNNPHHVFEESNYVNNVDSRVFDINEPDPNIGIYVGTKTDFQPGESIFVSGTITNSVGGYPMANQSVTLKLLDSAGLPVGDTFVTQTNSNGQYNGAIFVPTDRSGAHSVSVTLNTGATYTKTLPINIVEIFKPQSVPIWIFLLIAAIVIAVILIFSVYLYKYGLGKMVECGECGALIPESSKRCPRCGTDFETETAKCSECGTWIPARSKECPECGAKFMTEPVEEISEDDYMASMRRQYEEYINGYREQAKAALGKKYSEDKFMDWLKTEPTYLTFENWVAKQEEERKTTSVPCPSCGTLNPKGAPICSKCGTVFERTSGPTQTGETGEQRPFRKIVKRSSDRKMVPKKLVKEGGDQTEQAPEEQKKE